MPLPGAGSGSGGLACDAGRNRPSVALAQLAPRKAEQMTRVLRPHARGLRLLAVSTLGALILGAGVVLGVVTPASAAPPPEEVAQIPVGSWPYRVAVSPDGTRAYVTNYGGGKSISVIDTGSNTVVDTIALTDDPRGIAVSPDGTRLHVTLSDQDLLAVIDAASNTLVDTFSTGDAPAGVAVTADGARLYVANFHGGTVSVIDSATGTAVTTVSVGNSPGEVVLGLDGTRAYVSNYWGDSISIIDTASYAVLEDIAVGARPAGLSPSPDGKWVYVANQGDAFISTVRAQGGPAGRISAPDTVDDVGFSADGAFLYILSGNQLLMRNLATDEDEATLSLPGGTEGGIAVARGTGREYVYVTVTSQSKLVVFSRLVEPGAPTGIQAVAGYEQVTVGWAAPAADGGSPITGYAVQYRESGSSAWEDGPVVASTARSAAVDGLTNGTQYDFRVGATNSVGTTWSVETSTTPLAVAPDAPTGVAVGGGLLQAHVSWQAAPGAGSYVVTLVQGSATHTCATGETACVFTDLEPGAVTAKVVATNPAGSSPEATGGGTVLALTDVPAAPPADTGDVSVEFRDQGGKPVSTVSPGQVLTVVASGFAPFSDVNAFAYSTPQHLGGGGADLAGTALFQVTVPQNLAPGAHSLVAMGLNGSGATASALVTVQVGSPGGSGGTGDDGLATTGADGAGWLPGTASALLLLGAAVLVARRRPGAGRS